MKIEMTTKILETGMEIKEKYDISDELNPEEYAEDLINNFNATLRPHESPRKLISVRVLNEQEL